MGSFPFHLRNPSNRWCRTKGRGASAGLFGASARRDRCVWAPRSTCCRLPKGPVRRWRWGSSSRTLPFPSTTSTTTSIVASKLPRPRPTPRSTTTRSSRCRPPTRPSPPRLRTPRRSPLRTGLCQPRLRVPCPRAPHLCRVTRSPGTRWTDCARCGRRVLGACWVRRRVRPRRTVR